MRIEMVPIKNQNRLVSDYRQQEQSIMQYFDYGMLDYKERLEELKNRTYKRKQLIEVLKKLNNNWGAPKATFENIERLTRDDSVVVVGGQQAGLLTGPLYSVNKVISIIQLAKQQEKELDVPVIPIFWIAGEDHDFDEINHVFVKHDTMMKKVKIHDYITKKQSISHTSIDKTIVTDWFEEVIGYLAETNYTKDIHEIVKSCIEQSHTYVDFFARLIFQLFSEEGLVLIDSGDPLVRQLETDYFQEMILKQQEISQGVTAVHRDLSKAGYSIELDISEESGNLFYHKDNERILLQRNQEGDWVGKQLEVMLTTEELLEIAANTPDQLSNNVVSRPLMQDLLLPTLAFIGGPGEISYWSVLKPAFHALGIKMPPVVPRLSFTYITRKAEKVLQKYEISLSSAVNGDIVSLRKSWFRNQVNPPVEEIVMDIKEKIINAHEPLKQIASEIRADIQSLAEKNIQYLIRDIEFLEKRINHALEEQYKQELEEFLLLENLLHPDGLQERVWNPLPFLNEYGMDIFQEVSLRDFAFDCEHYAVYL